MCKRLCERDYDQLGKFIAVRLNRPVNVAYSDTLGAALEKKTGGKADLVIGKDSVVRKQAGRAGLVLSHVAALTGLDGKTTQTGLFIVPAKDSAVDCRPQGVSNHFGCGGLRREASRGSKLDRPKRVTALHKAETCSACSDGATKILDLFKEGTKSATIISSYAKPLLEGCGTVKKGDLRVIGETDPVPFVAAFINARLALSTREAIAGGLAEVCRDKNLCKALETRSGFVQTDSPDSQVGVAAKKN